MERCKEKDFLRKKLDPKVITGFLIEKIINQVQFATWNKKFTGDDILNDSNVENSGVAQSFICSFTVYYLCHNSF